MAESVSTKHLWLERKPFVGKLLIRGILYAVMVATFVWGVVFAGGIYRYHYIGSTPDHIAWLAPKVLPWSETIAKSAHIAGVAAALAIMAMLFLTFAVLLASLLILGIAHLISKGKIDDR